jgi:hypothetical protein
LSYCNEIGGQLQRAEVKGVSTLTVVVCIMGAVAFMPGLYGLHRLGLWLEDRGYIYYWRKKPKGSAVGSFVAFQRMIEPRAEYVIQATHVDHRAGDQGAAGQDSPPEPAEDRPGESTDAGLC